MKLQYRENLKNIIDHKLIIFKILWKRKMYKQAIFHDISKLSPKEFFPYSEWFYGDYGKKQEVYHEQLANGVSCLSVKYFKCRKDFEDAVKHHYDKNKHHWNHWLKYGKPVDMPTKYITEMICDWTAMGIKFGNSAQEYYLNNYNNIKLTCSTRMLVEMEMGLNDSSLHNYGHTLKQFANMYNEEEYNNYFDYIKNKYNIDSYKLLREK